MDRFDVFEIDRAFYAVVQTEHLLQLNTVVVVPLRPANLFPALGKVTIDVEIQGVALRVLSHMSLTLDTRPLQNRMPVHRLSPDEEQGAMNGLNAVLRGL